MKRFLSFLFLICSCCVCLGQFLPLMPVTDVPYYNGYNDHKRLFVSGTSMYAIRAGGMQVMDTVTHQVNYHWANHYALSAILSDTNGTYIYLKDNSFIGKYNPLTQQYENINTGPLQNATIKDIDIGSNGNIWAISWLSGSGNVGIYNAGNWQLFPTTNYLDKIRSINDTSAYVLKYPKVYLFHQGNFDSLYTFPQGIYFQDWDIDPNGDVWIAADYKLLHISGSAVTVYDSTNTPVQPSDRFLHVIAATDGHIWTCGKGNKLYEFDGANWNSHVVVYGIENFALDQQNHPWIIYGSSAVAEYRNTRIYVLNGASNYDISFSFMPYQDVEALGYGYLANGEGIFQYNIFGDFSVGNFRDSAHYPNDYVDDVTCFETAFDNQSGGLTYGTHHGVFGFPNLNNSLLPGSSINYLYYKNGTEYICTDSGLVMYNQTIYSFFNTSNTPLPSNKITFVIIGGNDFNNQNMLFIGTDKGMAIYNNTQWTVYDTTNIPLNSFYVTGILPQTYWYQDTATFVTTLGSGLIKLYSAGGYAVLNTGNGLLEDDSLFYVIPGFFGKCGEFLMVGTKHRGIATLDAWSGNPFFYNDTSSGYPFTESEYAAWQYYSGAVVVTTDAGLYWGLPCGGIEEYGSSDYPLSWYIQDNHLILTVPQGFKGDAKFLLHDITGREVATTQETVSPFQKISFDVENFSPGIYLGSIITSDKQAAVKVIIY